MDLLPEEKSWNGSIKPSRAIIRLIYPEIVPQPPHTSIRGILGVGVSRNSSRSQVGHGSCQYRRAADRLLNSLYLGLLLRTRLFKKRFPFISSLFLSRNWEISRVGIGRLYRRTDLIYRNICSSLKAWIRIINQYLSIDETTEKFLLIFVPYNVVSLCIQCNRIIRTSNRFHVEWIQSSTFQNQKFFYINYPFWVPRF